MVTNEQIKKLVYKDAAHSIKQEGWIDKFYYLWLDKYHSLDIVKEPERIIKPGEKFLIDLLENYDFDELHLFKIYENANVFALLADKGQGNWAYRFLVIMDKEPDRVYQDLATASEVKAAFPGHEPLLEIPLPHERKYVSCGPLRHQGPG